MQCACLRCVRYVVYLLCAMYVLDVMYVTCVVSLCLCLSVSRWVYFVGRSIDRSVPPCFCTRPSAPRPRGAAARLGGLRPDDRRGLAPRLALRGAATGPPRGHLLQGPRGLGAPGPLERRARLRGVLVCICVPIPAQLWADSAQIRADVCETWAESDQIVRPNRIWRSSAKFGLISAKFAPLWPN